jgi:uncharacterized protein (TIGR03083 family)
VVGTKLPHLDALWQGWAVVNSITFATAATAFSALVDRLPPDCWDAPGLGEWDVRALTGHTTRSLITVSTYLKRPARTEEIASPEAYYAAIVAAASLESAQPAAIVERGRVAGEALGADPPSAVRALVADVLPEVDRTDDPLIETIGGGMRLSAYLPTRTFELAVHSLDIAAATGVEFDVPADVLAEAVALAAKAAAAQGNGSVLLMSITGRQPLPAGFSVV